MGSRTKCGDRGAGGAGANVGAVTGSSILTLGSGAGEGVSALAASGTSSSALGCGRFGSGAGREVTGASGTEGSALSSFSPAFAGAGRGFTELSGRLAG